MKYRIIETPYGFMIQEQYIHHILFFKIPQWTVTGGCGALYYSSAASAEEGLKEVIKWKNGPKVIKEIEG